MLQTPSSRMAVQFFLSPYGSECGTAILDTASGQLSMLCSARYQTAFTGGLCLLEFDTDAMGYSALYESGSGFIYAAADVFRGNSADLYAVSGAPYLIGVAVMSSIRRSGDSGTRLRSPLAMS